MVLMITEKEITGLYGIAEAIDAAEQLYRLHGEGKVIAPVKINLWNVDGVTPSSQFRVYPAAVPSLRYAGSRLRLSHSPDRSTPNNTYCLFDVGSGKPIMVMFSDTVERLRVGASTGVAAKYLALEHVEEMGIYGTGTQAPGQLLAVTHVRKVKKAKVYSPNRAHLLKYCETMRAQLSCEVVACSHPEEVARGSQIVVTDTNSTEPVFKDEWLEEGVLISSVGANYGRLDLDERTVKRAKIVTESRADTLSKQLEGGGYSTLKRTGENAMARLLLSESIYAEIGEIVAGKRKGREGMETIWYKNEGTVMNDLATMIKVYELAKAKGVGTELDTGAPQFPGNWSNRD